LFDSEEDTTGLKLNEVFNGYMLSVFESLVEVALDEKKGNARLDALFHGRNPLTIQAYSLKEPSNNMIAGVVIICKPTLYSHNSITQL
jgi:hypothetical protein